MTGIPLLPVKQKKINHFLLVFSEKKKENIFKFEDKKATMCKQTFLIKQIVTVILNKLEMPAN